MSMTFVDSWGVPMSGWYDDWSTSPTLQQYDTRLGNLEWHCWVRSHSEDTADLLDISDIELAYAGWLNGEAHGRD